MDIRRDQNADHPGPADSSNTYQHGKRNREIQFYEISSFYPYCQICNLDSIPLKIDYASMPDDQCIILFGDMVGQINVLSIKSVGECLRLWKKKPKHENFIASVSLRSIITSPNVRFVCWAVHDDWVQQVKYYPDIRQVISCSNHNNTALVIGCTISSTDVEPQMKYDQQQSYSKHSAIGELESPKIRLEQDQTVFKVGKGIKCFDYNKKKNILVTGGQDRLIRIWNPYMPGKPTDILHGHSAPIFSVFYCEDDNWIYSVSSDKCVKVWNAIDYSCINTVRPKSHLIHGELTGVYYSNSSKTLAFTTNVMATLSMKIISKQCLDSAFNIPLTHTDPVTSVSYNKVFHHIVTASEGSEVKVWDVFTGRFISRFCHAHGDNSITSMTFDASMRRLLTGSYDGKVKVWNYNSGLCLKELMKEKKEVLIDECDPAEICDLIYVEMNRRSKYVIAVGWDRRINIYEDNFESSPSFLQYPSKNWDEDLKNGHHEEIICVAQSTSHMMATASYDGEIIVWKLMSGHIFCHLKAPEPPEYKNVALDGDLTIQKLLFIEYKPANPCKAQVIATGPYACITFWNIFNDGQLLAQFPPNHKLGAMITSIAMNFENTVLYSCDSLGFIYAWDIDGYCSTGFEPKPPPLIGSWRGHVKSIRDMIYIDEYGLVITAGLEGIVRMWTTDGLYIGVFGQKYPWDLKRPETFEHPLIPYDVLTDPLSAPEYTRSVRSEIDEEVDKVSDVVKFQLVTLSTSKDGEMSLYDEMKAQKQSGMKSWRKLDASDTEHGIYKILDHHELDKIPELDQPVCLARRKEDVFGTDFEYMKE